MKKKGIVFKILGLFLVILGITGCASTKIGLFAEQYNENSCVIFFHLNGSGEFTFKQVEPSKKVDERIINVKSGLAVFLPCEPNSKFLLTKIKGNIYTGSFTNSAAVTKNVIDVEMPANEQYYIIDVPEKPGAYYYGDLSNTLLDLAEMISIKFNSKNDLSHLFKFGRGDNPYLEKPFKPNPGVIKDGWDFYHKNITLDTLKSDLKALKKYYYGTLWFSSFEEVVEKYKKDLFKAYEEYKAAKKNK